MVRKIKRFYTAIILFIAILSLSIISLFNFRSNYIQLITDTENIKSTAVSDSIDKKSVYKYTENLKNNWENAEKYFVIYFNHNDLHDIQIMISQLDAMLDYQDYSEFFARIDAIKSSLDELKSNTYPSLKNLL